MENKEKNRARPCNIKSNRAEKDPGYPWESTKLWLAHLYSKMKYKDGRKRCRRIGEPRKSQSIYDNLGHPSDIIDKYAIFIGKKAEPYSLTRGKEYKILKADSNHKRYMFDDAIRKKSKKKNQRDVDVSQGEDYLIQIINDKGHKREYSHIMFKLKRGEPHG